MRYKLLTTSQFDKQFKKLDNSVKKIVAKWIKNHLDDTEDPYASGGPLVENLKGYWKYRIGSYRLIVKIDDGKLIIIAIKIENRSTVYKD